MNNITSKLNLEINLNLLLIFKINQNLKIISTFNKDKILLSDTEAQLFFLKNNNFLIYSHNSLLGTAILTNLKGKNTIENFQLIKDNLLFSIQINKEIKEAFLLMKNKKKNFKLTLKKEFLIFLSDDKYLNFKTKYILLNEQELTFNDTIQYNNTLIIPKLVLQEGLKYFIKNYKNRELNNLNFIIEFKKEEINFISKQNFFITEKKIYFPNDYNTYFFLNRSKLVFLNSLLSFKPEIKTTEEEQLVIQFNTNENNIVIKDKNNCFYLNNFHTQKTFNFDDFKQKFQFPFKLSLLNNFKEKLVLLDNLLKDNHFHPSNFFSLKIQNKELNIRIKSLTLDVTEKVILEQELFKDKQKELLFFLDLKILKNFLKNFTSNFYLNFKDQESCLLIENKNKSNRMIIMPINIEE